MIIRVVKAAVVCSGRRVRRRGQRPARAGRRGLRQGVPEGIADAYLAALVAHDPSKAPMAPNAKFTEQAQPHGGRRGQLWKLTDRGPDDVQDSGADPVAGPDRPDRHDEGGVAAGASARWRSRARRRAAPAATGPATVQLALRLKVQNRQITEAEHIFARIGAPSQLNALKTPRAAFMPTVPTGRAQAAELMLLDRQRLLRLARARRRRADAVRRRLRTPRERHAHRRRWPSRPIAPPRAGGPVALPAVARRCRPAAPSSSRRAR